VAALPPELLEEWKRAREGDASNELDKLDWLNRQRLQDLMVEAIANTRDELVIAIDKVADTSQGTLEILKQLIDESFRLAYLDADTVASLEYSARVFRELPDHVPSLHESARGLRSLPDDASLLLDAARNLRDLPSHVEELDGAARTLKDVQREFMQFVEEFGSRAGGLRAAIRQAQFHEVVDGIQSMRGIADRVDRASSSLAGRAKTVEAMERVSENLAAAASRVSSPRGWSWRSFWWGVVICAVFVVTVLVLWAQGTTHNT
jgi:hypothetical protein